MATHPPLFYNGLSKVHEPMAETDQLPHANIPLGTNTVAGAVRIATNLEASTGSAVDVAVNPFQLQEAIDFAVATLPHDLFLDSMLSYNTTTNMLQLLMSDGSTIDIDLTAAISDAVNSVPSATETSSGTIELATVTESRTGTDTTRAVTPAGLSASITDAKEVFTPSNTAPTSPKIGDHWKNTSSTTTSGILSGLIGVWSGTAWEPLNPPASTTSFGSTRLATVAEAQAGSATDRSVTPAGLAAAITAANETFVAQTSAPVSPRVGDHWKNTHTASVSGIGAGLIGIWSGSAWEQLDSPPATASITTAGLITLATNAETSAGIATDRAVTPAGLATVLGKYTEAVAAPTSNRVGDRWRNTNTSGTLSGVPFGEVGTWSGSTWRAEPYLRRDRDDTTTGNITVSRVWASLTLNKPSSGSATQINSTTAGAMRWLFRPGNDAPEAGADSGSDFDIFRYADNGAYLGRVMHISRQTGYVTFDKILVAQEGISANGGINGSVLVQATDGNQYARLYSDGALELFRVGYSYIDLKTDSANTDFQKRIYTNGNVVGLAGSNGVTYFEFGLAGAMWMGGGYGTAGQVLTSTGAGSPPVWQSTSGGAGPTSVAPASIV